MKNNKPQTLEEFFDSLPVLHPCNYDGCMDIRSDDDNSGSMRFCDKHLAEFDSLVSRKNYLGLAKWWIEANGGEEKFLAKHHKRPQKNM